MTIAEHKKLISPLGTDLPRLHRTVGPVGDPLTLGRCLRVPPGKRRALPSRVLLQRRKPEAPPPGRHHLHRRVCWNLDGHCRHSGAVHRGAVHLRL